MPLEHVAGRLPAPVEADRPGRLELIHPPDQIRFGRLEHQMEVVAHQRVGVDSPSGALAGFPERREDRPPVFVDRGIGFPPISTVENVVDRSGKFNAGFPCHRPVFSEKLSRVKPTFNILALSLLRSLGLFARCAIPSSYQFVMSSGVLDWPSGPHEKRSNLSLLCFPGKT